MQLSEVGSAARPEWALPGIAITSFCHGLIGALTAYAGNCEVLIISAGPGSRLSAAEGHDGNRLMTMRATDARDLSVRLDALTSLRFFAALAILIHHARGILLPADTVYYLWPLDHGVSFFFVLSGFVLYFRYRDFSNAADIRSFLVARVARIWPAHIAALILLLLLLRPQSIAMGTGPLIANILMIHAWIPNASYFFGYNSVSWSISTEFGFYLMFPLIVWGFPSNWWAKLLAAAAALVGLILLCAIAQIPNFRAGYSETSTLGILFVNPLARLFEFVVGMCAALAWLRYRPRLGSSAILWTIAEGSALALMLYYARFWHRTVVSLLSNSPLPVAIEWAYHASSCLAFAVVIFVLAKGSGYIGRLLSKWPLVFLGEISYSIYLFHQILIRSYQQDFTGMLVPGIAMFLLFSVILIAISTAAYFAIERPARTAIRKLDSILRAGEDQVAT